MSTNLIFLAIGVGIGAVLGYSKLNSARKDRVLRETGKPFPHQWREILSRYVQFYNRLSSQDKLKFEKRVHVFLLNVQVVGIDTEVTHEDRVLVAAGAIIPVFGFDAWHYSNLETVEIHPDKFLIPTTNQFANGLVGWGAMEGKLKLSRKALVEGFLDSNDQRNVAIHEFVHILDMQDGQVDGKLGKIMDNMDIRVWQQIINRKIDEIHGGISTIREYGKTSHAEFFAVVSEFYFENPDKLRTEHPEIYNALENFYYPNKSHNNYRLMYRHS